MKLLLDSGVWFRRYHGGPLAAGLLKLVEAPEHELWLCPLSITEMLYKWRHRRLPCPPPAEWLAHSLERFHLASVTPEIAQAAGEWSEPHGDFVDRWLVATARALDLTLVHTDSRLKRFAGFKQRYFRGVGE